AAQSEPASQESDAGRVASTWPGTPATPGPEAAPARATCTPAENSDVLLARSVAVAVTNSLSCCRSRGGGPCACGDLGGGVPVNVTVNVARVGSSPSPVDTVNSATSCCPCAGSLGSRK